jgi:hypothetical protein
MEGNKRYCALGTHENTSTIGPNMYGLLPLMKEGKSTRLVEETPGM